MSKENKKTEKKEVVNQSTGEVTTKKEETRELETLVSGAGFHDFEEEPVFEGFYKGQTVERENDSADGKRKAGETMGYLFENVDGEEVIIGNSNAIEKVIDKINEGDHLVITFKGKIQLANGKPYNQFKIERVKAVQPNLKSSE